MCTKQDLPSRPRRNRRSPSIREAISETTISPANLILPVFIHDGEQNIPIGSMPGVDRLGWRHGLLDSVAEARSYGVNSVVLFPKVTLAHLTMLLTWPMIALPAPLPDHDVCETPSAVQTPEELKTPTGEEAFNADGLVQRSIRLLKDRFPDLEVSCAPLTRMPDTTHIPVVGPGSAVPGPAMSPWRTDTYSLWKC